SMPKRSRPSVFASPYRRIPPSATLIAGWLAPRWESCNRRRKTTHGLGSCSTDPQTAGRGLLALLRAADYDSCRWRCRSPSREIFPMKFAAIIEYTPDKARIAELRPVHRQYLTSLRESGRLAAAGPFIDDSGALIVYEAESREAAEQLIQGDPFHKN